MFVRVIRRDALRRVLWAAAFLAAAVLLLYRPQALATGVSRGLSVCSGVIIPTLYPFMLLAAMLTDSPLCRSPGRLSAAVTRRLFGLPGCCGPAILLSLVGGYPAGALAIGRLLRQGQITREQARRMTGFCVNGGPGFIIGTVGSGLLGSPLAGCLLFAAHIAVSLGIGLFLGLRQNCGRPAAASPPETEPDSRGLSAPEPPRSLAAVVRDTCSALLSMCGFVVLAAAVLSLLDACRVWQAAARLTGLSIAGLRAAAAGLLEVSSGCIALAGSGALAPFWLSLCLGWGGLSVHGQLAAALSGTRLPDRGFFLWRLFHGVASGLLAMLLFRFVPAGLPAAAAAAVSGSQVVPYRVSAVASVMLLLLTFLAMLCFSPKRTGNSGSGMLQ